MADDNKELGVTRNDIRDLLVLCLYIIAAIGVYDADSIDEYQNAFISILGINFLNNRLVGKR